MPMVYSCTACGALSPQKGSRCTQHAFKASRGATSRGFPTLRAAIIERDGAAVCGVAQQRTSKPTTSSPLHSAALTAPLMDARSAGLVTVRRPRKLRLRAADASERGSESKLRVRVPTAAQQKADSRSHDEDQADEPQGVRNIEVEHLIIICRTTHPGVPGPRRIAMLRTATPTNRARHEKSSCAFDSVEVHDGLSWPPWACGRRVLRLSNRWGHEAGRGEGLP